MASSITSSSASSRIFRGVDRQPYANADATLRSLAGAAEGFGSQSIGGRDGEIYTVTSLADSGPNTLRDACKHKVAARWIVFAVSGTICLSSPIRVPSFTTIDGRGQKVILQGAGLQLRDSQHVILCCFLLTGGRGHDADAIQMKPQVAHVWVDRCTLSDYDDGLIDITRGSTDVTISRCHFYNHDKTMLIGADPKHTEDRDIRASIHHCFFDGTRQRHPRVRFGKVHLYNNYTRDWGVYAVCSSVEAQVLSQHCIYEAGKKKKTFEYYSEQAPDRAEPASGSLKSQGNSFLNGAQSKEQGSEGVFDPGHVYSCDWSLWGQCSREVVVACAGWQDVPLPADV
ncbi:unnamed protein product [Closterium sp. Naga37s-1]|nr:unnamed protein product [Closterium sp. Naga37s-1]